MTEEQGKQEEPTPSEGAAKHTVEGEGFQILDHEEPAGEPGSEFGAEDLPRIEVPMVLQVTAAQLAEVAWQKMGLRADPFTNKVEKDIAQARMAIDALAALLGVLLPHLQGQSARDLQNLLTDLRLNFVRQSGG
jgi:hypothetical protein